MPNDTPNQVTDQHATDSAVEELRALVHDVYRRLASARAVGEPPTPQIKEIKVWQEIVEAMSGGWDGLAKQRTLLQEIDLALAVAALDEHTDSLATIAEHAAVAVEGRAAGIDAVLSEIRRIRSATDAA